MPITYVVPPEALDPYEADGTTENPVFKDLTAASSSNTYRRDAQQMARIDIPATEIGWRAVNAILLAGGDVIGIPAWIVMDDDTYNNVNVPSYVPNYLDGRGNPQPWKDWPDEFHTPQQYGGLWYVGGNSSDAIELNGSVDIPLLQDPLYNVIQTQEYQDIVDANTPPGP